MFCIFSHFLVRSPPKLETESPAVVWFHIPSTGSPPKFSLKCSAKGDPEKYTWYKNGVLFPIDETRIVWQRPGQSGTVTFLHPEESDQGFYQCNVSNIFGVAMSNIFEVKVGGKRNVKKTDEEACVNSEISVLDHFSSRPVQNIPVNEGDSLTLNCTKPLGIPEPTIFWLYRDVKKSYAMDTVNRKHITGISGTFD
ncbi:unnamed protein product [Soboliphyme baturini]|uniref:Ig-like domain-containing protein n=1 Tax=Soboliphyme baturini TaxID=241478 RepID=A0A3P8CU80_9BILA|nr:unnamed protein product [Soboliphyme baturini]